MIKKYEYIDLFSGCGGLALGMYLASWRATFAVEKNSDAFETLKYNLIDSRSHFCWPDWLPQTALDINDVISRYKIQLMDLRGDVKLVAGGPPCQGFSSAGKRNENDARNKLVDSYLDFIDLVDPESILFENVKGFTMEFKANSSNTSGKKYSAYVITELESKGYAVGSKILDFSEFGVPQKRNRFILFASKKYNPDDFFDLLYSNVRPFLRERKLVKSVSISQAISDLEKDCGQVNCPDSRGFMSGKYGRVKSKYQKYCRCGARAGKIPDSHRYAKHRPTTVQRFVALQNLNQRNQNLSSTLMDTYQIKKNCISVLDANTPSPTLTSHPDDHIHYSEPRILSVREYARIQSFPDWYAFKGRYTTGGERRKFDVPRYTQIGNAIPPLIAEQMGIALIRLFENDLERVN